MNPLEYQQMADLERTHWWFTGTRTVILAELRRALARWPPADPSGLIADLGCGTGFTTLLLEEFGRVVGVERSAWPLLASAPRKHQGLAEPRPVLLRGRVEELPIATASLRLACGFDMLEHTDDDRRVLREIHRVLRPAGLLLLTVPAWPQLWSAHDEALGHRRRYLRPELKRKVEEAGFVVQRLSYYNTLLFPAAAGQRLATRLAGWLAGRWRISPGRDEAATGAAPLGPAQPRSDLRATPEPLNRWLGQLLGLERHLLRRVDLPLGLSLILLAQRLDHKPLVRCDGGSFREEER